MGLWLLQPAFLNCTTEKREKTKEKTPLKTLWKKAVQVELLLELKFSAYFFNIDDFVKVELGLKRPF